MAYKELTLDGFVQEFKSVSEGPYQRKFCFVLGAGASKTSGIKTGEELVDIWDRELEVRNPVEHAAWKKSQKITEKNKYNFYSRYYERRFERDNGKQYRDGYNFLENMMENAHPSSGYVLLSLLMSQKPHNAVITTNFDHLLEDSLVQYAQTMPMVIGHEKLAAYASHHISRPTVVKIHRDLLLDPINRPGELDKLHPAWEDVLDFIFSQYHPVFIGYAGNDNSVMDFLNQHVDKFNSDEWAYPYWMIYGGQRPEGKVRQFLTGTNGYLIRHKGFDQVFVLLCRALNLMPPDEEMFLKKAKKQYSVIQDSIEKILNEYRFSASDKDSVVFGANPVVPDASIENGFSPNSPSAAYINAVMAFSNGEYKKALLEVKQAVDLEPGNARYHNSLGVILHAIKRYNEALDEKQKAVELEPDNAQYHDSLGTTLHKMKRYDEALKESQKAVELEPNNAQYHYNLGQTLHEVKRYDEALDEKQKAVELEPDNAEYYDSLGVTLHEMKHYNEALQEVQKAVTLEPDNAHYHDSLGAILHAMKKYDKALEETQKAIDLEPDNARYYNGLGITLHEIQRYDEALVEKYKAVELEPNNAMYYNSLGVTLHAMGRYDEAVGNIRKAVGLKPDNAEYYNCLGITLYDMQRYNEALEEAQKAVDLAPDNETYLKNLGEIKKAIESQNPQ